MIVAAVDRSDRAPAVVREAASLAEGFDETLHAVHVMERSEFVARQRDESEQTGEPIDLEAIREIAAEHADDAAKAASIDRPYDSVGLVGDSASEIRNYAESNDARFVVVGPRKRSPAGKAVFGSVAQSIILDSPCPVVTTVERS